MIGADGIHSTVRRLAVGATGWTSTLTSLIAAIR
jgi:2-polyprenyl-6-methoxyphenol hydroxylase-like FAD-dependent oxidoreductase